MDIISEKVVTTRKPHRCFACLSMYPAGSVMKNQVNNYDGIGSIYWCMDCESLMKGKYSAHLWDDYENVFPWGCVRELMNERKVSTPDELLSNLTTI